MLDDVVRRYVVREVVETRLDVTVQYLVGPDLTRDIEIAPPSDDQPSVGRLSPVLEASIRIQWKGYDDTGQRRRGQNLPAGWDNLDIRQEFRGPRIGGKNDCVGSNLPGWRLEQPATIVTKPGNRRPFEDRTLLKVGCQTPEKRRRIQLTVSAPVQSPAVACGQWRG